ncbi:MAG: glycerophosphodiester phosphodiesterase family protein [Novosphingobium sp.]
MFRIIPAAVLAALVCSPAIAAERQTASSQATTQQTRAQKLVQRLRDPNGPAMIVAHRGCHVEFPENSLAAFRRCMMLGIDMIETDVQITRDGVLILMHDTSVDRTTNGSGKVADMTLAQIKKLRLRMGTGGPDAALTDETVPTFEEAMEAMRGEILVDLDAKGPDLEKVWAQSLTLLERMGVLDQMTVKLTAGRDDHFLDRVPLLKRVTYLQRVTSFGPPLSDVVRTHSVHRPAAYTVVFLNLPFFEEGVTAIKASGARAWAEPFWGATAGGYSDALAMLNPDANWGRLIDAGATVFLTDRPESLAFYLAGKGLRPFGK